MEYFKIPESEETVSFIKMFDKAFDCLNVRSRDNVKENQRAYFKPEDKRLRIFITHSHI